MKAVRASHSQDPRHISALVDLKEWNRHGWTYHAKGMLTPPLRYYPYVSIIFICRDLAFTKARLSTHSHTLWLYKPELAFCPTRH